MKARNPRTGEEDYDFLESSREEVAATAATLRAAQASWEDIGPAGRAVVLHRFADAIDAHAPMIVEALSVDTGRGTVSMIEVQGCAANIRRWAQRGRELFDRLDVGAHPSATPGVEIVTTYSAFPLFGAIAPWNFPVILSHIDAVPALMAGCAAMVKPSEVTPRFVEPMRTVLADIPELPLAYVMGGPEVGQALIEEVDYVCFTGSTATGRKVAEAAARALIPANLELGGKDPMIVTANAEPDWAAGVALRASVVATGQACQSIERIYVAREIAEAFLTALVAAAERVELTWPDPAKGHLGPFIFPAQADKVQAHIDDARSHGARVLTGGEVETLGGGKYLRPTLLADVTPEMKVMREETFGPVIPVTVFDDLEDAIAQANDTEYGLSAAVLAGSLDEATAIGVRLDAGAISLQDGAMTSFVGDATNQSRGCSGLGPSRMGDSGMLRFLREKALIRQTGDPLPIDAYAERGAP
ncbi:aldehyde dehydrogenase family protein [Erythrobacter sp. HL-111]|uniref:aldehyde dehydrogenase family protein n=1 Tax=Erythrobacter sp. HL-111 TaxID=1798193 RepID=UPI0006D9E106|nr:aldehyde dehydrogenase family protein [Erythrobacter sp. HL-111]KPP94880.1 MAG: succinate-semialdehyde dehydrogenase / glutarate-semialdehyde dehydrogenase [Erythrobacteraceae bacterium HL-111]SDS89490.1 Acyl-CoA reductase [Erythrobacter sp. HL-111]